MASAPIPDNNYGSPNEETSRLFRANRAGKLNRHGRGKSSKANQFRPPNLRKGRRR